MKKRLIVGIVLVVATTGVVAQDKLIERKLEAGLVVFDRDEDNALSETEFKYLGEYPQPRIFDAGDKDKDGFATLEEVRAYFQNRNER